MIANGPSRAQASVAPPELAGGEWGRGVHCGTPTTGVRSIAPVHPLGRPTLTPRLSRVVLPGNVVTWQETLASGVKYFSPTRPSLTGGTAAGAAAHAADATVSWQSGLEVGRLYGGNP